MRNLLAASLSANILLTGSAVVKAEATVRKFAPANKE